MPRLHSGNAIERPEIIELPPIPEVLWQQPQETHLSDMYKNSTTNFNNSTHKPNFKRKNDVESQTSPIKETSPQISGSDTERLLGNQTRSTPVHGPNNSKKQRNEIPRNETDMTTYDSGDDNISAPKITTSEIEGRLVRDEFTNELYMPLSCTIVLKRTNEMLYVPLNFKNGLAIDPFVHSGA